MLTTLVVLTMVSLILSLVFTPLVRSLAIRFNLVDLPDNKRKVHKRPVPRVGGVAVAAAYFGSLVVLATVVNSLFPGTFPNAGAGFATVKSIAPAAFVIFLIGLADDIFTLKATHKFLLQTVAAAMVVYAGVQFQGITLFTNFPVLGMVATVIWLVGCTNAVNLIDGLDGLAGGIALFATLTVFIASIASGNLGLAMATAPLAGALIGFLVFNFNPASIFLGDSGSLLLGFLLGCYSVLWSGASLRPLEKAAPLIALSVPLLDTTLAIVRRFLRGQPIFAPDRSHIHHRLLARELGHRTTVLCLYGAAVVAGSLALCLVWSNTYWQILVLAGFVGAVLLGIGQLRYAEFGALGRAIWPGDVRREITTQLAVQTFEEGLNAAETLHDYWAVIQRGSEEFGLTAVRMKIAEQVFERRYDGTSLRSGALRIPLSEHDWIEVSHHSSYLGYPMAVVPLANTLRRVFADRNQRVTGLEVTAVFSAALV